MGCSCGGESAQLGPGADDLDCRQLLHRTAGEMVWGSVGLGEVEFTCKQRA